MQKNFAARWNAPVGSSIPLRVPTHCFGRGARKYKLAVSSVSFARAAVMLCFCESVKAASGCLQTNLMASFRPLGLTSICGVAAWKTSKAGGPDEFVRTLSRPSKRMRVDRKGSTSLHSLFDGRRAVSRALCCLPPIQDTEAQRVLSPPESGSL